MYSSIGSSSQTIGNSGCGPTSLAMVLSYYTRNNITPDTMADYAVSHGYRTSYEGTSWEIFNTIANEYNLEFMQTSSSSEALDWLQTKSDALIICSMGPGLWTRQGHFIVVWGEQEGEVFINDPASLQENRIRNSYNTMANQCRQFFCYNQNIPEAIIEAPVIEEKTLPEILRERLYLSQPTFNIERALMGEP